MGLLYAMQIYFKKYQNGTNTQKYQNGFATESSGYWKGLVQYCIEMGHFK